MTEFKNKAREALFNRFRGTQTWALVGVYGVIGLLVVFFLYNLGPRVTIDQLGYRGVAMENIQNVRTVSERNKINVAPDDWPPFEEEGVLASEAYENVPAFGHLTQDNFDRMMTLITEWVSPEEGCNYCHVVHEDGSVDYVSDEIYTKVVSRRMIQMTQHINSQWGDHVAPSGVTCYTCHRGNPVPPYVWYQDPIAVEEATEGAGSHRGQNMASFNNAWSSLPYEVFTEYLTEVDQGVGDIRIIPTNALPLNQDLTPDLNAAERTYGLMMHISEALGINCTYCHNSRSFIEWERPQRVVGWYGIRLAQDLNQNFLIPLQPEYPEMRLGPVGDAPKLNCMTCHQAVNKPLNGVDMISSYPSLQGPGAETDLRAAAYHFVTGAVEPVAEEAAAEAPAEEAVAEEAAAEAPAEEAVAEEAAAEAPAEEAVAEEAAAEAPAEEAVAEEAAAEAPAEEAVAEEAAAEAPAEEAVVEEAAAEAPAEEAVADTSTEAVVTAE